MVILQINSVCGIGSTGRIASDLHNLIVEQGLHSYVAYGRKKARNCTNALRIGSNLDVGQHLLRTMILGDHGYGSRKSTTHFIKTVQSINPDIIHLHNIHGFYLNIEELFTYLKKEQKPVVWTLHDCWSFTGHCAYFDYVECSKWEKGCFGCPQRKAYPFSLLRDNSIANFTAKRKLFNGLDNLTIVTPSSWLAKLVNKSYLGNYDIKTIHNGIDFGVFKPRVSDFRDKFGLYDKFVILGVANIWEPRKGLYFFHKLASKLNNNEVLVLVGLNKLQIKDLPDNIIGISRTDSIEELAEIYTSANVFVNLSLEDNFPTTILEAQACGKPVITFDTGGSAESIDSSSGVIVQKGDLETIEKTIRLIKNGEPGFQSDVIRDRAKALFDKTTQYHLYIDIYKELAHKNNTNINWSDSHGKST